MGSSRGRGRQRDWKSCTECSGFQLHVFVYRLRRHRIVGRFSLLRVIVIQVSFSFFINFRFFLLFLPAKHSRCNCCLFESTIWMMCMQEKNKIQACFVFDVQHFTLYTTLKPWSTCIVCMNGFSFIAICLCWNASRANRSSNFHLILKQNAKQAQGIYIQKIELIKCSRICYTQHNTRMRGMIC